MTKTTRNNPLLERFLQVLNGQFRLFVLILSFSPQNFCGFRPIYHYIRSLVGKAIEYYSCFISYSSKDEALAKRLYADLQSHNVRCWFAPEDLKWGERTRTGIDQAIRIHDKLLLILSKHSLASGWVEQEVKMALDKERKECHLSDKKERLPRKVPRCQAPSEVASATITWRSLFTKTISAGYVFALISFPSCAILWWQKILLLAIRGFR